MVRARAMVIKVNISQSLATELLAWFRPRDEFAPVGDKKVNENQLGVCHEQRRNCDSDDRFRESYGALRSLKDLRRAVDSLASAINDGIKKMEREVLPLSRHRGLRSLPPEIVVNIMALVANQLDEPQKFKSAMWSFLKFSPFGVHFEDAKGLVARWERMESVWDGRLPQETSSTRLGKITEFHFSLRNSYTLSEIRSGLKPLKALEHLHITCAFDYKKIMKGDGVDLKLKLSTLKTLTVSNLNQFDIGLDTAGVNGGEPLSRIISMLDMPNLTHIKAHLTFKQQQDLSGVSIVNDVFNFTGSQYPNVKVFDLARVRLPCRTAYAFLDLSDAFSSFRSLKSLTLGSCDTIVYNSSSDPPEGLRNLRLVFEDCLACAESVTSVDDMSDLWGDLQRIKALTNVEVVTKYDSVFSEMQKHFPGVERVTDKSILEYS